MRYVALHHSVDPYPVRHAPDYRDLYAPYRDRAHLCGHHSLHLASEEERFREPSAVTEALKAPRLYDLHLPHVPDHRGELAAQPADAPGQTSLTHALL